MTLKSGHNLADRKVEIGEIRHHFMRGDEAALLSQRAQRACLLHLGSKYPFTTITSTLHLSPTRLRNWAREHAFGVETFGQLAVPQ
ncbi:MAG: hypothetical protein ABUL62_20165 [Myxococcales bacterium]